MKNRYRELEQKVCLRILLVLLSFVLSCDLSSPDKPDGPLPMDGVMVQELAALDDAMQQYMTERNKNAGVLGVMKNGVIVFERSYGWKDKMHKTILPFDAMLRIASITKPITKAAIKKLIREGRLNAADKVFCLPGSSGKCLLNIEPFGTPDPRLKDLTVQNLLDHKAGWDEKTFNALFMKSLYIASTLGISCPPGKIDLIRFMMGQPLVRAPGSLYEYSNFGHVLLGVIIEQVTGQTYIDYVQENIFNPLGVQDSEIEIGRTMPDFRNPREPWYESRLAATSVFNPPSTVSMPDGGMHLEIHEGASSIITSSRALLLFMQAYWADGSPRIKTQVGDNAAYGAMPGTFAAARWKRDGVNYVALFNKRNPHDENGMLASEGDDLEITVLLDRAINSIKTWPAVKP